MPRQHRIYLEVGKQWVFACALDWPGWARRGKGEEAAIDALHEYAERYAAAISGAGAAFDAKITGLDIIGRVDGNMTTDFGAPSAMGPWDDDILAGDELEKHVRLLEAEWATFDQVVAGSPPTLRKGPRGGGRDRDAIAAHVKEAERAYAPKIDVRIPKTATWPEQRLALADGLGAAAKTAGGKWPARYGLRRIAWHVLDHAWEIEDKRETTNTA